MADRNTTDQVESIISAAFAALDQVFSVLDDRDKVLHVLPTSVFLPFSARSQLLGQTPADQIRWVNAGLRLATEVLANRAQSMRYGKNRRVADCTIEMAQTACDLAQQEIDRTSLRIDKSGSRSTMLYRSCLEFSVVARILEPMDLGRCMSACNERVAEVRQSGWIHRNVVKIRD